MKTSACATAEAIAAFQPDRLRHALDAQPAGASTTALNLMPSGAGKSMAQSPPAFRPAKKDFGYSTGLGLRTTDPWRGLGRSRQSSGLCCIHSLKSSAQNAVHGFHPDIPRLTRICHAPSAVSDRLRFRRRHHRAGGARQPGPVPRHRHRHRRPLRPGTGNHPRAGPGRRARHRGAREAAARRLATSPGSRSNRWISPGWTACAISPGASWPADSMSTC